MQSSSRERVAVRAYPSRHYARHWHGASADTLMTHFAVAEVLNGSVVTSMEHVTDEQYRR